MIIPQILPNVNKTKVLILSNPKITSPNGLKIFILLFFYYYAVKVRKKNEIAKYIMLKNDNKGIYIKIVNKWVVF